MHITEDHLRHMARRHHSTMQKLDGIKERVTGIAGRFVGTIETATFAWIGGALEGKTGGYAIGPLPINLLAGAAALALSHANIDKGRWNDDLNNFGNGLVGSWLAATGYAFGKRWRETKSLFGGGEGSPWGHPYQNGWPHAAPTAP
jgi:hypothetical protein